MNVYVKIFKFVSKFTPRSYVSHFYKTTSEPATSCGLWKDVILRQPLRTCQYNKKKKKEKKSQIREIYKEGW